MVSNMNEKIMNYTDNVLRSNRHCENANTSWQSKLMIVLLVVMTAAISGCAMFGPKYTKPVVNMPSKWNSESVVANAQESRAGSSSSNILESTSITQPESAVTYTAWWKKFNDPILNDIIDQVLANNNNIQVAIGNMLSAQSDLEKTKMLWIPTLSLGGGGFIGQSFNQNISSNNPSFTTLGQQNSTSFYGDYAGFVPSYSVNILQLVQGEKLAKLNVKMRTAAKNAVRLAVIGQAAGSYFALLGLNKQLILQKQMIADAESLSGYVQLQVNAGAASPERLSMIRQVLAQLRTSLPTIEDNIVATNNALRVLMNKNPGVIDSNNSIDNINVTGVIPLSLPSQVLKSRPDLVAAEAGVEASNTKIGLSMSEFFPSINLISPVGTSSFQLSNLFSGSTDFWMTQVAAAVPILNLGIYADIDRSKADYYSAYYRYIQTVRNAFAEVDDSLSKYHSAAKICTDRADEVASANDLYTIGDLSYQYGKNSYADTIGFKLNLDSALLEFNQAKINQLNSIVNLYQVLGGGYDYHNTDKATPFHDKHDI